MGASNQLEPRTGRLTEVLPIAAVTFVALLGFGAFIPLRDDRIRLGGEIFGSTGI